MHLLARLEEREVLPLYRNLRAGAWIAPGAGGRSLTEKTPNPRNSTRSPRASAAVIVFKILLTMFSTSRW